MNKAIPFLMYHELESPGRALCEDDPGYSRYIVGESEFKEHMSMISASGWSGWNVSQALQVLTNSDETKAGVCLTFDDGCATDLLIAAPILVEKRLSATFYITVNHLGRQGYLTRTQVRTLAELGFEIGSHSMNHCHLNDLKIDELLVELGESKKQLEDIAGSSVLHFSCPGGRTNSLVEQVARNTGYHSVVTSRIGLNTAATSHYALGRLPIKKGLKTETLASRCRGQGMLFSQAQSVALSAAKRVLGNSLYERVRAGALR
jgi:peptidoglycan/xylan/chitin deacetylase (PgdA/CDA1 family)